MLAVQQSDKFELIRADFFAVLVFNWTRVSTEGNIPPGRSATLSTKMAVG